MNILTILGTAGAVAAGGIASFLFFGKRKIIDFEKKQEESRRLLETSQKEAEAISADAKKTAETIKKRSEEEKERKQRHIEKLEGAIQRKEIYVKKHEERNGEVKSKIIEIEKNTKTLGEKSEELGKEVVNKMAAKIGSTIEKERRAMIEKTQKESQAENVRRLEQTESQLKENAEKEAREILTSTMQRLSSPTSVEKKGREITVPKDYVKGEIVGTEAKNIQFIEEKLDVNIVFNDFPNTITVASYNLLNQHIAAKTIQSLANSKRKITQEIVQKAIQDAKKETENELEKIGKEIADTLKLRIKSKKLYELIGRLRFRTSYGQNILKHSLEVAWISMMLGSELGLNIEVCKTAGFLHDLGKAIDQNPDVQGAHDFLTKELMTELGFSEEEIHAAWTHHEAEPAKTPEAMIVKAADAVSAGRPGARQETLDRYLERLRLLEETANSFAGVRKSFAISAGREIRIIVEPQEVTDEGVREMAKNIAQKIEQDLMYPGKIKVNVIRRVKAMDTAK